MTAPMKVEFATADEMREAMSFSLREVRKEIHKRYPSPFARRDMPDMAGAATESPILDIVAERLNESNKAIEGLIGAVKTWADNTQGLQVGPGNSLNRDAAQVSPPESPSRGDRLLGRTLTLQNKVQELYSQVERLKRI